LVETGLSDDSSESIKTIFILRFPEGLGKRISDNVGLSSSGGFVSSSEFFELKFVFVAGCIFGGKLFSLGLVSLEGITLGSLKLTGSLTGESVSGFGGFSLGS
jgi:hypothetical protein